AIKTLQDGSTPAEMAGGLRRRLRKVTPTRMDMKILTELLGGRITYSEIQYFLKKGGALKPKQMQILRGCLEGLSNNSAPAPAFSDVKNLEFYEFGNFSVVLRGTWAGIIWFIKIDRQSSNHRENAIGRELKNMVGLRKYVADTQLIGVVSDQDLA